MVVSLRELLDGGLVCDEEALEIARHRAAQRESFGPELARHFGGYLASPRLDAQIVRRGFALVEAAAQPAQYRWLVRAGLLHDDPSVRAAAIALLSRQGIAAGWIEKLAMDAEERVRAGTMEALWTHSGPEIERVLTAAMSDLSENVVASAVYGLYLIDPERHLEAMQKLASHRIPAFRCAAAALIGKLDAAVRGQFLKPLLTDPDPGVRRVAFQTLAALKNASNTSRAAA